MRTFLFIIALVVAPFTAFAARSTPADIISLPEFKVFEDRPLPPQEKWDYVKVGNFEILSNASTRVTKQFVRDLSEFQIVLGIVSPVMRIRSELPVMIVLCARDNQFQRFVSKPTVRSIRGIAASLVRDSEIASIIVDYESLYRADDTPFFDLGGRTTGDRASLFDWGSSREVYASEEFIRQYIHLSLSELSPRPPAWLAEGIASIYSNIDYNNKWIEIGLPKAFGNSYSVTAPGSNFSSPNSSSFSGGSDYAFAGLSSSGLPQSFSSSGGSYSYQPPVALIPMEKLFGVNYDSPVLGGGDFRRNAWKYQATAFVHLCVYGENGRYRQGFLKFAARASTTPPTEQFFKECFGIGYKEMAVRIRSYTEFTNYIGTIYKVTKGGSILQPAEPFEIRRATDAEIGRIKGESFRLSGQDEDARREFVVAYLRGERDPQLLASLGLMARQRHDDARARTYLEAIATTTPAIPRPRAYLELARLRSAGFTSASGARPLDTAEVSHLLTPLFTAQQLPQQLLPIYLEIAAVWDRSIATPTRENLGALEYGVRLFPRSGELILRTAALLIKHGYQSDAAPLIQRTLNSTRDPELKSQLELLRQKIDSAPTTHTNPPTRFSPEANLGPELRQRLSDYRAAKAHAVAQLRVELASAEKLTPASRQTALAAFAAIQTPRLRSLENEASRLEPDLGWPPDEGDDYAPGLTDFGNDASPAASKNLDLLSSALLRPRGLSPPQAGLVREMIVEAQDGAAPRGAFLFFSPDTARIRLPENLPQNLSDQIAAFSREKEALKNELHAALISSEASNAGMVHTFFLNPLAEQQAPRFATLESRAETIRRQLAQLPPRSAPNLTPHLPPALAAQLVTYQNQRDQLRRNSRRDLRALRSRLPPAAGIELAASGDPPRLLLKTSNPTLTPELLALRTAVDGFNRDYAIDAAALNRELAELRRLIAEVPNPDVALIGGKSVNDLMRDFTTAALRQASAETYRDYRAAVFEPGLSPEQRRLLFERAGEKMAAVVLEF